MQRLSIRQTRRGTYRIGHDARHIEIVARDRQDAHRKGKAQWRAKYGTVAFARV